jgi:hypothetical protein
MALVTPKEDIVRTRLTYFDLAAETAVPSIRLIPNYESTASCRDCAPVASCLPQFAAINFVTPPCHGQVVPDLPATNLVPLHPASVSPCTSRFQAAPVQAVLLFQIDLRAFGVMLKRRRREEFIVAASASRHRWNSIPEPLNNLEGTLCHDVLF